MLDTYLTRTQRLLQNPAPADGLYPSALLTDFINIARRQLAGEAECIRRIGSIDTINAQREYSFADIDIGVSADTGVSGVFNIRRINYVVGDGQQYLDPQPWEWFDQYCLNNPVPLQGGPGTRYPQQWAIYAQGSAAAASTIATSGTFFIDPVPDDVYTLKCDCVCFPNDLEDDTDKEAIPFPWTDAVPFFAAYLALLSAQTNARLADADRYFDMYTMFVERGRRMVNPSVLRPQYEQSPDPTTGNKLASGGGG